MSCHHLAPDLAHLYDKSTIVGYPSVDYRASFVDTLNDLDKDKEEITEEMLNQLAVEDLLAADFYQLSLNALSSMDSTNSIKLRTLVKNKVMLILLDSGSSHSFVSKQFIEVANLPTTLIPPKRSSWPMVNG